MELIPILLKEFKQEAQITKKFLERVPSDKLDWQPHEKSMAMKNLAVHIAELPIWVDMALNTDGLDFAATPYKSTPVTDTKDLLRIFENAYNTGSRALQEANEQDLNGRWILRRGDLILADMTKYETIRHSIKHIAHHRAQLGVYFRLLDIPLPSTYGPSADE
ncbi:MAG TPA: DinB family protein [Aequorivita sp.]|nr:DinB family protein [Aequorivita sp.]